MNRLRYPVGEFRPPKDSSEADREVWIGILEAAPERLRDTLRRLEAEGLGTPYREGGWTVRQVVHHLPDSYMNAYLRFKWALT